MKQKILFGILLSMLTIADFQLFANNDEEDLEDAAANSNFIIFNMKKSGKFGKNYDISAQKIFSSSGQKFFCYINDKLSFEVKIKGVCYNEKGKKEKSQRQLASHNLSGRLFEHYLPVFREAPGLFSSGGVKVTYTFEFKRLQKSNQDVTLSIFSGESLDGSELDTVETDSVFTRAGQHQVKTVDVASNQKISFTNGSHGSWQVNVVLKGGKGVIKYSYQGSGNNMVCFMVPAIKFKGNIKIPTKK
jgi:hypothetical protein